MKILKTFCLGTALFVAACSTPDGGGVTYRLNGDDILILQTAKGLLSDESKWAHHDDQRCDLEATTWTLFCALQKASNDVLGEFQLRRPALEEVRGVVEEVAGQTLDRRLIDFNNLPSTSFEDVHRALDISIQRVQARLDAS